MVNKQALLEETYNSAFEDELEKIALVPASKLFKNYVKSGNSTGLQRLGNVLNVRGATSLKKSEALERAGKDPLSHLLRGTSRKVKSKESWSMANKVRKIKETA